jgi:hypothetical protein
MYTCTYIERERDLFNKHRYLQTISYSKSTVARQSSRPYETGLNSKKYSFTVCCLRSGVLQYLSMFSANKFAVYVP